VRTRPCVAAEHSDAEGGETEVHFTRERLNGVTKRALRVVDARRLEPAGIDWCTRWTRVRPLILRRRRIEAADHAARCVDHEHEVRPRRRRPELGIGREAYRRLLRFHATGHEERAQTKQPDTNGSDETTQMGHHSTFLPTSLCVSREHVVALPGPRRT